MSSKPTEEKLIESPDGLGCLRSGDSSSPESFHTPSNTGDDAASPEPSPVSSPPSERKPRHNKKPPKVERPPAEREGADRKGILAALRKAKEAHPVSFEDPGFDEILPVPFLTLQTIMGGGPRRGRMIEVFGNEGTGKTTLTVQLVGANMGPGDIALFQDYEHTFSPEWAALYSRKAVVHLSDSEEWFKKHGEAHQPVILWATPPTLEEGATLADELVNAFGPRLRHVIVDSVAQMIPKAQRERGMEQEPLPALRARRLGEWIGPAADPYHRAGTCLWLINQVREKLGAMGFSELSKVQTPGGRIIKFMSTHRLYVASTQDRRWEGILGPDATVAEVTCCKNKVDYKKRGKTKVVLIPGLAFSPEIEVLDLAEEIDVLKPGGPGTFTFQGRGPFSRKGLLYAMLDKERGKQFFEMVRAAVIEAYQAKSLPLRFKAYEPREHSFDLDEALTGMGVPKLAAPSFAPPPSCGATTQDAPGWGFPKE